MLIPRMGEYIVQKGLITEADLQRALDHQKAEAAKGRQCLLGQALMELNLLDRETLDQVITEQLIQLRSALEASHRTLELRVKERTAELDEALKRLSELSQMKANFVSNISHELRTPLTHIKGYIDLLISESLGSINEEQYRALEVSQKAADKLESIIEDLIMFSLASRGELSLKMKKVDISALASAAIRSALPKAAEREVNLVFNPPENLPLVQADPEKIGWALHQLLDNGIKFTPSGGRVELSLKEEGSTLVTISVADSGIGIPSSRFQEVFEPFHQLDGSSTRRYSGTGLGLSLVRQIVEAHGSMLELQSVEGKGSTFKFPLLAIRE